MTPGTSGRLRHGSGDCDCGGTDGGFVINSYTGASVRLCPNPLVPYHISADVCTRVDK